MENFIESGIFPFVALVVSVILYLFTSICIDYYLFKKYQKKGELYYRGYLFSDIVKRNKKITIYCSDKKLINELRKTW
jgi:hypothetical protein